MTPGPQSIYVSLGRAAGIYWNKGSAAYALCIQHGRWNLSSNENFNKAE